MSNYDAQEIKAKIHSLDVREGDFDGCSSLDQEFTVILRKTGDLKAFCDPSETGFARRIRGINDSYRTLKKMYDEKEIDSFCRLMKDEGHAHDDNGDSNMNEEDVSEELSTSSNSEEN